MKFLDFPKYTKLINLALGLKFNSNIHICFLCNINKTKFRPVFIIGYSIFDKILCLKTNLFNRLKKVEEVLNNARRCTQSSAKQISLLSIRTIPWFMSIDSSLSYSLIVLFSLAFISSTSPTVFFNRISLTYFEQKGHSPS